MPPQDASAPALDPAQSPYKRMVLSPVPDPLPESLTHDDEPRRRPRGKIRRLPREVRKKLNEFLDDGLNYKEVIAALGPDGEGLKEMDISRWYTTGFQDWLKNQVWLENTIAQLDMAVETVADFKETHVQLAALHIAATQLLETLLRKGERLLEENPDAYVALVNSVSRLARESVNYQKYCDVIAAARAEIAKAKDPHRRISEEETLAVVDRLDEILGFK